MNQTINNRIDQIKKGQVPVGYENTSFGVFPVDWEKAETFGTLFNFYGGLGKSREELGQNGVCYLHYGDIHRGRFNRVSYEQYEKLPKFDINLEGDESFLMKDGDIAFLDASEDLEGTSRAVMIDNPENNPFIAGLHIIVAKDKKKALVKEFKQYITLNESVYRQFRRLAVGFKVYGLNRETISWIKFAYPNSKTEQARIAEILMKWDEAVELQESYIAKLETRKKALMQKLLTPKTEWVKIKLGDSVAIMTSGGTPLTSISNYYDGDIVWVSIDDISSCGKYLNDSSRKITSLGLTNSSAKLFPINTILYAMYASIGKCTIAKVECSSSQAILGIVPKTEILDFQFLYYHLCNIQEKMILQGQKGTQANLNKDMVSKFKISIPLDKQKKPNVAEQKHIAKILSSADEEISLQKQKLEKLKEQRKSMQQLLLTGIVRV